MHSVPEVQEMSAEKDWSEVPSGIRVVSTLFQIVMSPVGVTGNAGIGSPGLVKEPRSQSFLFLDLTCFPEVLRRTRECQNDWSGDLREVGIQFPMVSSLFLQVIFGSVVKSHAFSCSLCEVM